MLWRMDAVRCLRCGGTRWAFLPGSLERMLVQPCETCGGRVVVERRRPGARHARLIIERRHAARARQEIARR
jgi:DNA-directed RNA polymerase subunit RPC12/RpoP